MLSGNSQEKVAFPPLETTISDILHRVSQTNAIIPYLETVLSVYWCEVVTASLFLLLNKITELEK